MSTMTVVECDQGDCANNCDGHCSEPRIRISDQECMSYAYEGGYEDDEDDGGHQGRQV